MDFNYSKLNPQTEKLPNGIPLYMFQDLSMDVVRIEFIFEAGSYFQDKPLQAQACCSLLENTKLHSATEMNEKFDYYGAYVEKYVDRDQVSIVIYVLKRYAIEIVKLCEEIFKQVEYSEKELELYLQKSLSRFDVSMQKVSEVSRRLFYQSIFGKEHPYGRCVERDDFAKLKLSDPDEFYRNYYLCENAAIVIAGGFGDDLPLELNKRFGDGIPKGKAVVQNKRIETLPNPQKIELLKDDAVQASVRMGKTIMLPTDEAFARFKVLDYVFGGYFGSRIMKNIREEKGYTYGISSYIVPMRHYAVWIISSEVKQGCSGMVISEIEKEMKKLCDRKISEKELDLVRNVHSGDFLREMDGTFEQAEKWKFLKMYGLNSDFYKYFAEVIGSITPEEIRTVAQEYFDPTSLHKVWVGA